MPSITFLTLYTRHESESESADTDDEYMWGGIGIYEYGAKGLPHAILHASELVKTFGHHGACCSSSIGFQSVGEAGHKLTLKTAAKFSRTYGDKNKTQSAMLGYVCFQNLWTAVFDLNEKTRPNERDAHHADVSNAELTDDDSEAPIIDVNQLFRETNDTVYSLRVPLHLTDGWRNMVPDGEKPPAVWGSTFLSKRVLITRNELVTLMRSVLGLEQTWSNITRLARCVHWESFGCCVHEAPEGVKRILVGINPSFPGRRDFVRLRGSQDGTALSAQIIMFVRVSGLSHAQIAVSETLLNAADKTCNRDSVILALVRWLSPDPLQRYVMVNCCRCVLLLSGLITHCGNLQHYDNNGDISPIICSQDNYTYFLGQTAQVNVVMPCNLILVSDMV